jgi:outer membrane protein assembly complex protein YaeT
MIETSATRARNVLRRVLLCACIGALCGAAGCKEESGGVKVSRLSFSGLKAVTPAQLKSVLATTSSSRLPWGERYYFSREQFEADLKRIVAFYRDRGYPDAKVASFDARLSEDQKSVRLTVNISEGEPIRAERVELVGFEPLPEEHRRNLETRLPLKPGQPMDRALMQASREAALDELRDHGHPYASVRLGEEPGSSDRLRVLSLHADAGPFAQYGPVEISGNTSVNDDVIRRQLTFRPGEVYQQSKLQESQRKLYQLEVFDFVNVEALREGEQPPQVPTRVTVTEGKHRKVNFGVGYGTEEKARAVVDWRHVNFFGGARSAGLLARYSSLDGGIRLNFRQPYVFSPRYSFGLQGQYWHTAEPAFWLDTVGGRATITRQFARAGGPVLVARPATTLSFTYANEWEQYEISNEVLEDLSLRDDLIALGLDPRTGSGEGQRSAISVDAGQNTTGNLLDARRGYAASVHLEQAGKFLQGDFDYYQASGELRMYRTLGTRAVIAAKVRAGSIDGIGADATVPFFKRYFLGGATNLRGWGRFDVAPLSGAGLPLGGHSFMDFSTEVRLPIIGNFGGVVFLDGGNVWANSWDINLGDLRYDVGPGLRYNTPIGPLRADIGFQLNRIPGLLVNGKPEPRRFRFHFSIGQAF